MQFPLANKGSSNSFLPVQARGHLAGPYGAALVSPRFWFWRRCFDSTYLDRRVYGWGSG